MKKLIHLPALCAGILGGLACLNSASLSAATHSAPVSISTIGCHLHTHLCYAYLEGEALGPSGCHTDSIRWSNEDLGAKENFAILHEAFVSKRLVKFAVADSCLSIAPDYPTFEYILPTHTLVQKAD